MDLRANTAVDVLIGPFVDSTNGDTAETGLTIEDEHVKLSKLGQALAAKTDANDAGHDADGYYNCPLDTTDTNTEGNLVLTCHMSGALPVRHEYNVLAEGAWDSLYSANDDGLMDVNVSTIAANAITATAINADAITAAKIADDAISSEHLNTGALTADAFAADAIVAATLATGALTADAFAADAIVAATLATDAISADAIADNAIAAGALAADCITEAKIADNAIAAEHLNATACTKIIDDFETQSQADPTGFHVNVKEVGDTAQTAGDLADLIGALNDISAADVWDATSATLSLSFESIIDRTYRFMQNKINITDADGSVALRNEADDGNLATQSITDDDTTTVRTALSWA